MKKSLFAPVLALLLVLPASFQVYATTVYHNDNFCRPAVSPAFFSIHATQSCDDGCLYRNTFLSESFPLLAEREEPKESELFSKSCALMDGDSGRILYTKSGSTPLPNASTTKILTCIVALENSPLDSIVEISPNAASQPKVHLGVRSNERYYLKDMLYALMLESFNDCAVAIAEHLSGNVEDFSALMNQTAEKIGCKDTFFITPNGLDAKKENMVHHTTAEDLCLIMRYCTWQSPKKEEFLKITQTPSYQFSSLEGRSFSCINHNAFLSMMDGVLSGKTGFTGSAGYCYTAALERDGKKYCIALLACGWPNNRTYKWKDARKLFSYGMENYERKNLFQEPSLKEIKVKNGRLPNPRLDDWGKTVTVNPYIQSHDELWYLLSESDQATPKIEWKKNPSTSQVQQEEVLGEYRFFLNGTCIRSYDILADKTTQIWNFADLFVCMIKEFVR